MIRPDRSIHDSLSVEFLKILGAGAWQEDMMRDGLVFLWKARPPGPYRERNNKSALDHLPQLRDTVATWEKAGFVERLSEPALCCNPMTVAVQYNLAANSVKYRPCIDLS